MGKRRSLLVVLGLFLSVGIAAQQLPMWSQFRSFNYQSNPAFFDHFSVEEVDRSLDLDLAYRLSWTSIEGAPRTGLLGAQYVDKDWNMSMGGAFTHDRFGPLGYSRLQGFYAYRLNFSAYRDHGLSIGISGAFSQFRIDGGDLVSADPSDQLLNTNLQTASALDAGLGIYYSLELGRSSYNPQYLMLGLAAERALPANVLLEGNGGQAELRQALHFNGQLAFRAYYGGGLDYVEPIALFRLVKNSPLHVLAGLQGTALDQRIQGGLLVSSSFEVHLMFAVEIIPRLRLGYAASLFLSNTFSSVQRPGLSHELSLGYRFVF